MLVPKIWKWNKLRQNQTLCDGRSSARSGPKLLTHDLYIETLAGTNGSIQKGSPRNSPLHSVRAGEDHIHKGENFHPRVVNCVSACTTITDKILTLSFFLLFFQQFWSWSCTASTTTQCLILTDFISFFELWVPDGGLWLPYCLTFMISRLLI